MDTTANYPVKPGEMHRQRRFSMIAAMTIVALAMSGFGMGAAWTAWRDDAPTSKAVASHNHLDGHSDGIVMAGHVMVPSAPTDGVLTITIPRGTDSSMKQSGDAGYHLPPVIRLTIGDTVVIRNDDDVPHMILFTFLLPGESVTRVLTTLGSETYSSGCAAHAASFPDFTTIFITKPASASLSR